MLVVRRLQPRKAAEFAVIATLAAAITLLTVWGLGLWDPTEADDQPPLTLSLSPPAMCETETARSLVEVEADGDDPTQPNKIVDRWWGWVDEVEVGWIITGGEAPYTLTLDDETFTAAAIGAAEVSCALRTGPTERDEMTGERRYEEKPLVDSGVKTIAAEVVDAQGNRVSATATMDVVLDTYGSRDIDVLEGGKTYRVLGILMTIPAGINIDWSESLPVVDRECDEYTPALMCGSTTYLTIADSNPIRDVMIGIHDSGRVADYHVHIRSDMGVLGAEPPLGHLTPDETRAFDLLAESFGRLPNGELEEGR